MKVGRRGGCFYPAILHKRGRGAREGGYFHIHMGIKEFLQRGKGKFSQLTSLSLFRTFLQHPCFENADRVEGGFFKDEWEEGRHMLGTALTFFKKSLSHGFYVKAK